MSARNRELLALIPVAALVTGGFTAVFIVESNQIGDLSRQTQRLSSASVESIAYLGNELSLATADKMGALAQLPKLANEAPNNAIQIRLETASNRLGTITFTNRTDLTLHHCLVLTRLSVDREFIRKGAAQEDLVGKLVLPLLGFSKQTVAGSQFCSCCSALANSRDAAPLQGPRSPSTVATARSAASSIRSRDGRRVIRRLYRTF